MILYMFWYFKMSSLWIKNMVTELSFCYCCGSGCRLLKLINACLNHRCLWFSISFYLELIGTSEYIRMPLFWCIFEDKIISNYYYIIFFLLKNDVVSLKNRSIYYVCLPLAVLSYERDVWEWNTLRLELK